MFLKQVVGRSDPRARALRNVVRPWGAGSTGQVFALTFGILWVLSLPFVCRTDASCVYSTLSCFISRQVCIAALSLVFASAFAYRLHWPLFACLHSTPFLPSFLPHLPSLFNTFVLSSITRRGSIPYFYPQCFFNLHHRCVSRNFPSSFLAFYFLSFGQTTRLSSPLFPSLFGWYAPLISLSDN